MNREEITDLLDQNRKWLRQSFVDKNRLVNIITGTMLLCSQVAQPLDAWLAQKGRRGAIKKLLAGKDTKAGRKVLTELLDLAEIALKSCNWTDWFSPNSLPGEVRPKRKLSKTHAQRLHEARDAARREQSEREAEERAKRLRFAMGQNPN